MGAQVTNLLQTAAREFSSVYTVLDALDECKLKEHRKELLDRAFSLESLVDVEVHIMATSRDSDRASYDLFSGKTFTEKKIGADPDDILQYIERAMLTGFMFKFRRGHKPHLELQEGI